MIEATTCNVELDVVSSLGEGVFGAVSDDVPHDTSREILTKNTKRLLGVRIFLIDVCIYK